MNILRNPMPLLIAASLTAVGCMGTHPTLLPKVLDASLSGGAKVSTDLVLKFKPEEPFKTQAAGTYRTIIKLMYTEALVRTGGFDYHIGLDSNGLKGQKLNYGLPLVATDSGVPAHSYYSTPITEDDPLFSLLGTTIGSDPAANVATDSVTTGAYFLGRGIYRFPVNGDMPVDIMYDGESNPDFSNATDSLATFSDVTDPQLTRLQLFFNTLDSLFSTIFQNTEVYTNLGDAYNLPVLTAAPFSVDRGYILAVKRPITTKGGGTATATYYKMVLPGGQGINEVRFPNLPLGRLVLELRRYSSPTTLTNYGYGQFLLNTKENVLDVGTL